MSRQRTFFLLVFAVLAGLCVLAPVAAHAQADDSPPVLSTHDDVYNPFQLLTLNLELDPTEWEAIKADTTFDEEFEASFWADGGVEPILVSVRRKSADALPLNAESPQKVSLKIDINEYVKDQRWYGLKKLSLENGDDHQQTTFEGFAWYMHRLAAGPEGYGYMPGRAAWVKLYVHLDGDPDGTYVGVFINVEQPDKSFLRNRDLWDDDTWLIKYSDILSPEVKEGDEDASNLPIGDETFDTLCYLPFQEECDGPETVAEFTSEVSTWVNMQGMLTLGAVDAIQVGPDQLFSKGKNFYHIDRIREPSPVAVTASRIPGRERLYIPWDLDSNFTGINKADQSIYDLSKPNQESSYEVHILDNPTFRDQYDQIICNLLTGPFVESDLIAALNQFETLLTDALNDDANNAEGIEAFGTLRSWLPTRLDDVEGQLPNPCDTVLAVTLTGVHIERDGSMMNFDWSTATEIGNAGFNLYADSDNGLVQLNETMIPSTVIDSVVPTSYSYAAMASGQEFYIEMVGIDNSIEIFGPFGATTSTETAVWLPIIQN